MTISRVRSLLGIAQRAGFVVSGSNLILSEVSRYRKKTGQLLVLVAADAQTATGEDLINKCLRAGLIVVKIPMDKLDLGLAIGKNHRGYVMIKDSGIIQRILALLEEMEVRPLDQSENL